MSRRSLLFAVGIVACLVCGVVGVVIAMVRHEPAWYQTAAMPAGPERTQLSTDFLAACSDLKGQVDNEPQWGGKITSRQVNSWFEDGLFNFDANLLHGDITEPRIAFEPDRVRFGFRHGKGLWSSIVSMTLHVWVPQDDSSAVVLELESLEAGSLPVSAQSVLEEIARVLREKELEINWYRHNGHPTAVIRFRTDQQHSPIQLTAIQARDGVLVIQGRNNNATGPAAPASNP
jgi:hypothetical protein